MRTTLVSAPDHKSIVTSCPLCGAEVDGRWCSRCLADVTAAPITPGVHEAPARPAASRYEAIPVDRRTRVPRAALAAGGVMVFVVLAIAVAAGYVATRSDGSTTAAPPTYTVGATKACLASSVTGGARTYTTSVAVPGTGEIAGENPVAAAAGRGWTETYWAGGSAPITPGNTITAPGAVSVTAAFFETADEAAAIARSVPGAVATGNAVLLAAGHDTGAVRSCLR